MARRRSWLWIPILLAFLVVAFYGATWFLNRLIGGGAPAVASDSVLHASLSGTLVERPMRLFGPRPIGPLAVREIDTALRDAAEDDRVTGVLLDVGPLSTGFAKAQEVRAAIHAFRESGKPVVALLEIGTLADLYVASAADTVVMIPSGNLLLGLVSRTQYYADLLGQLGVEVDVFATGEYKSFGTPYTQMEMTPEERVAIDTLIGDVYEQIVADIAEDRDLPVEGVRAAIDRGLLDAEEALAAQLIDSLGFRDQARDIVGLERNRTLVSLRDYRRTSSGPLFPFGSRAIALVHVDGTIVPGDVGDGLFGDSGLAGGETIARYLRQAREDTSVGAVVLRVDSPGGAVTASDVILREVQRTAVEKPVVVSMSDVAASGGYWIATGATRVFADRATFTGSIGVVSTRFNLAGTYEKIGVGNAVVKRGRNADLFLDSERLDDEQLAVLQQSVERHYDSFLDKVATAREMSIEEVEELAAGRVWTGAQALERGLVDDLGGYREALESARRAAGIGLGDDYRLLVYPEQPSFLDGFFGLFTMARSGELPAASARSGLPEVDAARQRLDLLRRLSSSGHAWAITLSPVPAPAR